MKVIINADDFGVSDEVNQSVINMHRKGIVSSTTIMANGPDFEKAVELLSAHPDLGVGVHLCLDGPYNSSTDHTSLLDPVTNTFFERTEVIKKIHKSYFKKDEIYREFSLQLERVLDHGLTISHLDTHHHFHLYFPVLKQVIRVARKYGISFIRSQRIITSAPLSSVNRAYRLAHHLYLNTCLRSVPAYYDPAIENNSDFAYKLNKLEGMLNNSKGPVEIMLHPRGDNDPETRFFSSPEVQQVLSRHLILNYKQLN